MSEDSKEKIVAGAYRALTSLGYASASVKDIAAEAAVAPGLVHYYFETKEDLLVAAIEYGCRGISADLLPLAGMDALEAARAGFRTEKEQLSGSPDVYRLIFDMVGVGLHNPKIAGAVKSHFESRRQVITAIGAALLDQSRARPGVALESISAAIWAAFIGISVQKLIEPDFDSDGALDALAEMVFAYIPTATREGV